MIPSKRWRPLTFVGGRKCEIASTLAGRGVMPSDEMLWLRNKREGFPKTHFKGLIEHPPLWRRSKSRFK